MVRNKSEGSSPSHFQRYVIYMGEVISDKPLCVPSCARDVKQSDKTFKMKYKTKFWEKHPEIKCSSGGVARALQCASRPPGGLK